MSGNLVPIDLVPNLDRYGLCMKHKKCYIGWASWHKFALNCVDKSKMLTQHLL